MWRSLLASVAGGLVMFVGGSVGAIDGVGGVGGVGGGADVRVGLFGNGEASLRPACFSTRFLDLARVDGGLDVGSSLEVVALGDVEAMSGHPIAVMSGEGSFSLSGSEVESVREYLERGGFLIASAGCSSAGWAASFEGLVSRLRESAGWERSTFERIEGDHALMSMVYEVGSLSTRRAASDGSLTDGGAGRVYVLTVGGRACVVYSPDGLNDTDGAGGGCCCCGGSEIREARWLKVNAIAYAVLR